MKNYCYFKIVFGKSYSSYYRFCDGKIDGWFTGKWIRSDKSYKEIKRTKFEDGSMFLIERTTYKEITRELFLDAL